MASGYLGVWGLEDAREHRRGGGGGSPGTSEGKVGVPMVSFGGVSTANNVLLIGKRVKECVPTLQVNVLATEGKGGTHRWIDL